MKHILFYILSIFLTVNLIAGGKFFVATTSNNITLEKIENNKPVNTICKLHETYDCKYNYSVTTPNNNDCIFAFSNDLLIKIGENSRLGIDNFEQSFSNLNELPEIANGSSVNCMLTAYGSFYIVNKNAATETASIMIGTDMGTIILSSGKFVIRSEEKSLLLIVLNGTATVTDSLSKREQIVKEKNMLVVVPAPKMQGKAGEHMKKQNMFSVKPIDESDSKDLIVELNTLLDIQSNIKFIVVNKDVIGVKIH